MISGLFGWWFWPFLAAGVIFAVILGVLAFIFWIWMLVDCIQRKFKNDTEKIIWVLVIILVHWIGALIYYFAVKVSNLNGIAKS